MTLHHGDCLDVMAAMEPESVDAIVTDPPYDLTDNTALRLAAGERTGLGPVGRTSGSRGFMGKRWDGEGIAFRRETWELAYRVAKPSAYLLAFGGTRTVHRMTCALEDAGWLIRDMLVWGYASGFPKSKASLKPAWEPIVMARKPGPLRMLAIDECRIPGGGDAGWYENQGSGPRMTGRTYNNGKVWQGDAIEPQSHPAGRWPANIVLTDPIFDGGIEGVVGGGEAVSRGGAAFGRVGYEGGWTPPNDGSVEIGYGDTGTYSRFFLIPKAARSDREPVLGGLPEVESRTLPSGYATERGDGWRPPLMRRNSHPTVKPTDLMRHLVRLVTPTGGVVLDPFGGSGTTALACEMEGFDWILIEREAEYVAIAEARLNGTQRGLGLVG